MSIRLVDLGDTTRMKTTLKQLCLYGRTAVSPIGQITLEVMNWKNNMTYECNFAVAPDAPESLLGARTSQEISLLTVTYENIANASLSGNLKFLKNIKTRRRDGEVQPGVC